jgi:hypothetical protein
MDPLRRYGRFSWVWRASGHRVRDTAGAVGFVLLGASLLATSAPPQPPRITLTSDVEGPPMVLDNEHTAKSYRVTARATGLAETGAQTTDAALLTVRFAAEHSGWQAADAGASDTPWVTVALVGPDDQSLLESPAFLTAFDSSTTPAFVGDCKHPDPQGPEPCQTSFTVTVERAAVQQNSAKTTVRWSLEFSSWIAGEDTSDAGTELPWDIEVTEL